MLHGSEKRPHEMHAHCERGGIAYIAICGRSRVIWRVTTRTPRTLRTRVLHFLYLFPIYYLHNILIITNHHRIIISKNSPATAYVPSNLSEVSGVGDCTHDLRPVSGSIGDTVKKYAACAVSGAQAACCALLRIILLPRHPAAEVFSLLYGIFRSHSLLSQSVPSPCPVCPP